jgi:excisionase family DNA binding protein
VPTLSEPDPADRLLVAAEVADLLQVTPAWVYAETRRHRLPHVRLGRYVRYRRSAIERFLTDAEAASTGAVAGRPGPSFHPTATAT